MHNTVIPIERITTNVARRFRASDDEMVVDEYAELYKAGVELPRLDVFRDGEDAPAKYILANGDKRYRALIKCKIMQVSVTVHDGSLRDAYLFAAKANYTHGVRPTRADKRKTVDFFLDDEEWGKKTATWIADVAGVSHHLVKEMIADREAKSAKTGEPPAARIGRDGKTYQSRPAEKAAPKPGSEKFNFEQYDKHVGAVSRGIDDIATAYKLTKSPEYHALNRLYKEFHQAFLKWKKKVLREHRDG